MFYTPAAEELRAFIRDKLGFPSIDTGGGWLIFNAPEVEIGCHPSQAKSHGLSFYCDDLPATMAELKRRGVEFTSPIKEEEWGRVTRFRMPGGDEVDLYQRRYATRRTQTHKSARRSRKKSARKS